jgi:hypothetical protein
MVEEKKVLLMKVDTLKNVADSLTKSVSLDMCYILCTTRTSVYVALGGGGKRGGR